MMILRSMSMTRVEHVLSTSILSTSFTPTYNYKTLFLYTPSVPVPVDELFLGAGIVEGVYLIWVLKNIVAVGGDRDGRNFSSKLLITASFQRVL